MKKKTAYFVAFFACVGIFIVWSGIFSLKLGVFWLNFISIIFIGFMVTTWRAITKKPKREAREEAVKNIDYNKEVLIRIDEEIEIAKRSKGSDVSHDLIWILENQCTDREAAQRLIDKYAEAFNKNLIKSIGDISYIIPRIKIYLDFFIEVGIEEATEQILDQEILNTMKKKTTQELTEILNKNDTSVYKKETFTIIEYILKMRNNKEN